MIKKAITAAVAAIVGAMIITSIGIGTSYDFIGEVDTQSEWSSYENTASNVVYTDGDLQLADSNTSGSYTSNDINYTGPQVDEVTVYADIPENASATVTVQGYDGGDAPTSATSSTTLESGVNRIDVSGLGGSTTDIQVEYSLSRDSGTVDSAKVDSFRWQGTEDTGLGNWEAPIIIVLIAAGIMAVVRYGM